MKESTKVKSFLLKCVLGYTVFTIGLSASQGLVGHRKTDGGEFKFPDSTKKASERMQSKKAEVTKIPVGMVKVAGGPFLLGRSCKDIFSTVTPTKKITISSFYMDATEVTNAEYRKSIAYLRELNAALNDEEFIKKRMDDISKIKINNINVRYLKLRLDIESKLSDDFIDTLIPNMDDFKRDFKDNSGAETFLNGYYDSEDYSNFPVVCVTWNQAVFFTKVRTLYLNEFRLNNNQSVAPDFALPSFAQWTYAANGGIEKYNIYPWGGSNPRNGDGILRSNIRPTQGDCNDNGNGSSYMSDVKMYEPNNFGLYDMGGNVKEWVKDSYDLTFYAHCGVLDPVCNDPNNKFKVVCGASFHDPARNAQLGNMDSEHDDRSRGDLGFRCIMSYDDATSNVSSHVKVIKNKKIKARLRSSK